MHALAGFANSCASHAYARGHLTRPPLAAGLHQRCRRATVRASNPDSARGSSNRRRSTRKFVIRGRNEGPRRLDLPDDLNLSEDRWAITLEPMDMWSNTNNLLQRLLTDDAGAERANCQRAERRRDSRTSSHGSLKALYGVHPSQRRNHTKGTCALGDFRGYGRGSGIFALVHVFRVVGAGCGALLSPAEIRRHPMRSAARAGWGWNSGCPTEACST